MNTHSSPKTLLAGFSKFLSEVCLALFISSEQREFQRWKDFIAH
jgi:hypothetical protein